MLNLQTFEWLHQKLCTSRSFCALRHDTSSERYCRIHAIEEAMLHTIESSSLTSSRAVEHALGLSHFLPQPIYHSHISNVWQQSLCWCNYAWCSKSVQEIWFKLAKCFHLPNSTSSFIVSMLHFCTHILYEIYLFRFPLPAFYIFDT